MNETSINVAFEIRKRLHKMCPGTKRRINNLIGCSALAPRDALRARGDLPERLIELELALQFDPVARRALAGSPAWLAIIGADDYFHEGDREFFANLGN